jgi:hypothetical protein
MLFLLLNTRETAGSSIPTAYVFVRLTHIMSKRLIPYIQLSTYVSHIPPAIAVIAKVALLAPGAIIIRLNQTQLLQMRCLHRILSHT